MNMLNVERIKGSFPFSCLYFLLVCALALFTDISFFSVFLLYPLAIIRKDWILAFLFFSHLLKGALLEPMVLLGGSVPSVPAGVLTVALLSPLLFFDIFETEKKVPRIYLLGAGLFALLLVSGLFVHIYHFGRDPRAIFETSINLTRIGFFLLLLKFLISKDKAFLEQSLKNILLVVPLVLLLVGIHIVLAGERFSYVSYLVFGTAKHGEYSAILAAFSVYVLYSAKIFRSVLAKLFHIMTLIAVFFLVILMASMNGFVSFLFMLLLGCIFLAKNTASVKKAAIVLAALFVFVPLILLQTTSLSSTPLFYRIKHRFSSPISETVRGQQALAVLRAFPDAPLFGWGGTQKAARWVSEKYGSLNLSIHNIFLDILVKHGLFGLVLYGMFLLVIFRRSRALYKFYREKDGTILFLPVLCFWLLLFSGMFVSWLWNTLIWYNAVLVLAANETLPGKGSAGKV